MVLPKVQCAEQKKVPLLYCCNRVSMKIGGQILWNVTPICETSQIIVSNGKMAYERRFGQPLEGPTIPTAKDQFIRSLRGGNLEG